MAVVTAATIIRTLHRIQRQLTDLRGRLAAGPKQIAVQVKRLEQAEHERPCGHHAAHTHLDHTAAAGRKAPKHWCEAAHVTGL